jgi:hypothetical protein
MGNVKAEYCIEPQLATQKDDKIFQMNHIFVPSGDKKKVYWVLYEPEGKRGYDGFFDAYKDRPTYYASFQPVVMKIELENATISDQELPLGKEYLSYSSYPMIRMAISNEVIFFGRDRKNNTLGLSKYVFE